MTCARCGAENPPDARFCARCGAALTRAGALARDGAADLTAALVPSRLAVAAGGEGSMVMKVRNLGTVVDRLDVAVEGPVARWTEVVPVSVRLLPGDEAAVELRVHPPRASQPPAGPLDLLVEVTSAENNDVRAVANGTVDIGAFYELEARVTPEHARAWRRTHHTLFVHNGGNTAVAAQLTATDPDEALRFSIDAPQVTAEPGGETNVRVEAIARRWHFWGKRLDRPFSVAVSADGGSKLTANGTLSQRPLLTLKLLLLLLLLIVVVIAIAVWAANH